jgi:hypothetical protein
LCKGLVNHESGYYWAFAVLISMTCAADVFDVWHLGQPVIGPSQKRCEYVLVSSDKNIRVFAVLR